MKSKNSKSKESKEPIVVKELLKEGLDRIKILKENESNLDKINKELTKMWSEIVTDFNMITIEINLTFNPYTI